MLNNASFFDSPEKLVLLQSYEDEAVRIIKAAYSQFKRPALLWSGGKDSMVLLYILRKCFDELPAIICWREPWMPEKQQFVNSVIQEWGLVVYDYLPSSVALCKGNNRIDVLNHYQVGENQFVTLARGTEPPEPGRPFLCGVNTFLMRPTGTAACPWDLLIIGHKDCDEDPTSGPIPLSVDIKLQPGGASACFPIRGWTDRDVLDYTRLNDIPHDVKRYRINANQEWVLSKDKDLNPDYYHTCFKCCDKAEGATVLCPKLKAQINNISDAVNWQNPVADYCSLRTTQKEAQ